MPVEPARLFGMVHLLPLPGSPRARSMPEVIARAISDAGALCSAGFPGLVVENFGDAPFLPGAVEPVTVAAMARALIAVRAEVGPDVQIAVNVLRNDARAALALATALELDAVRINVHVGARVTDQGLLTGLAHDTARLRIAWGATRVALWADVRVKHSAPVGAERPLQEEIEEAVGRGLADAVILTGAGTGVAVDLAELRAAVSASAAPVFVGSGASEGSIGALLDIAHGVIVGTGVKRGGATTAPVDPERAARFVAASGLR